MESHLFKRIRFGFYVLFLALGVALISWGNFAFAQENMGSPLKSLNWEPHVKESLNEMIALYGNPSIGKNQPRPYAVFDFDNTTTLMDVEEQLMIWQLEHLAFAIPPTQLQQVLETGIPKEKLALQYGADDGEGRPVRIDDAIYDAVQAYTSLYKQGAVTPTGKNLPESIKNSPEYKEFVSKMRWLYDAIGERMDNVISYPWVTYWFTGMTPDQVYRLAYNCDLYYKDPQKGQTWTKEKYNSPSDLASRAGTVSVSYKKGLTVTPEVKELYKALSENGFDIWIDSASALDVVRAAVDAFSIPGVTGIVAMTNKLDPQGRYLNAYDYELHPQTQGEGKALTIVKCIAPKYQGQGPTFCAMDSQGDFNFCTEFKDTKAVLVMNRCRTDDAALCAAIAVWQKQNGITLKAANAAKDAKFLLQGRNENAGELWPSERTLQLGKTKTCFISKRAQKAIEELNQGLSIAALLKKETGLKDYPGYKTR